MVAEYCSGKYIFKNNNLYMVFFNEALILYLQKIQQKQWLARNCEPFFYVTIESRMLIFHGFSCQKVTIQSR